ncbi:hypothetical protein BYT27DRAFT_6528520 [Phlegmacium glaucopus]|nr:hypothetical protein BYT27DRAFT_6528520 [Phlegmacium glaucopus]
MCPLTLQQSSSPRILFRSIKTNNLHHIRFLVTINQNPQPALYVHEYNSHFIYSCWHLLKYGLENMVNLKELCFRAPGDSPRDLLENCTFQLDRLTSSGLWDTGMTPFLAKQPLLTYLDINCEPGTEFFADVCPNLKELKGNTETLNALLPGRPITSLDWTSSSLPEQVEEDGISRLIVNWHSQLKNIRTLTVRQPPLLPFRHLADHLPSLETFILFISPTYGFPGSPSSTN